MKKGIKACLVAVLLTGGLTNALWSCKVEAENGFKDIPSGHWAKQAIESAVGKGHLKGYSDGTFRPNSPVTRAEFAAILSRVSTNAPTDGQGDFTDLQGNWSEQEVNKAIGMGFISTEDYPNGFKPASQLTRREMAKWMSSGLGAAQEDFKKALQDTSDTLVPVAEYYKGGLNKSDYPYVSVVLGTGLMTGYEDGTFAPGKTTTRAEVAAILSRFEQVQKKKASSFRDLNEMREVGLTGTNLTSLTPYVYGKEAATGEVASFTRVKDRPFQLRNNLGTETIHRMIVVDAGTNKQPRNLYGKMFVDKDFSFSDNGTSYQVFTEATVLPNGNNLSNLNFANSTGNHFASGYSFNSLTIKNYNLTVLPIREFVTSGFFTKNVTKRFWMHTTIKSSYVPGKDYQIIDVGGLYSSFFFPKPNE